MARRWLVVSVLCWVVGASPGHAQELLSTKINTTNAGRTILAGPDAVGGIGDWALQNGTVGAVVADPPTKATSLSAVGAFWTSTCAAGRTTSSYSTWS